MSTIEQDQLIKKYPEYLEILKLAQKFEEDMKKAAQHFYWEWSDIHTHPAKLVSLVCANLLNIAARSNRHTFYTLSEQAKELLKKQVE